MRRVVLPSLLASLLLMPVLAWSQEAVQPPTPPAAPKPRTTSVYVLGDYLLDVNSSEVLQARIDLDAKDMPAIDAIKSVLDQAKVKYEIAPDAATDAKITMTLKNVPAGYALMMLTREAKLSWAFEKKDDKETFRITKRDDRLRNRMRVEMPEIKVDMPEMENAFRTYMSAVNAAPLATARAFAMPANLPDVRVKIDVRNTDARDILKRILEQAKVDYVLDNDIPGDARRSFTFENIPLATALDMVCQSVEVGWRAENREKKLVVMVGKKYTRRNWITVGARPGGAIASSMPATIFAAPISERRATFTCPHCKARAVVVLRNNKTTEHKHGEAQGKDQEKEGNRPWKFCPVCGKNIEMGTNVFHDSLTPLSLRHATSMPELRDLETLPCLSASDLIPVIDADLEAITAELEFSTETLLVPPDDAPF